MTKNELVIRLGDAQKSFVGTFESMNESELFAREGEKWNAAEHLNHLILAVKPLHLAFALPLFVLWMLFGKPNRPSRDFEELRTKYYKKLAEGGKASKPYIPEQQESGGNKKQMIVNFNRTHNRLIRQVKRMQEEQLDKAILPHPLLGKITLREMICFTVFHIQHHHKAIRKQ